MYSVTLFLYGQIKFNSIQFRRERLTTDFAKKASESTRFSHWFKKKNYPGMGLRRESKFEEYAARTERLRKSPLFHMRRVLNEQQ